MKKQLLSFKGLIAVLALAIMTSSVSGQDDRARQDLGRSFRKFELLRIRPSQLSPMHGSTLIKVKADGRDLELELEPNDIRSSRYRTEDSSRPGERLAADGETRTFKGRIKDESDSSVRISIDGNDIEGYFSSRGQKYFIEPARKYSNLASDEDSVIYREEDSLIDSPLLCGADIAMQLEQGKDIVSSQATGLVTSLRVLEVATDADFQYVSTLGGATQANNEILAILNMTEGVYEAELNLTISVVYQHTWSTPDPFPATSMNTVLDGFQAHWNANMANVSRDTAHLFSGKPAALSAGLAWVGTICRVPTYAYGLSGYISWAPGKYLVPTHEIGHNLSANHADGAQGCANTVMNPQLSGTTPLTFCTFSRTEITTFVSANGSCLTAAPTPTPTPPPGGTTRYDFDGDARADIAVFRPSTGVWYTNRSTAGFGAFQFGQNGDRAVPADYDGDGRTDGAVYRSGVWYRLKSSNNSYDAVSFGLATDVPAPADFDGDGRSDPAVFRPSTGTWYVLNSSSGGMSAVRFGMNGDVPVAADYDGDRKADINLFRPSSGTWYRINSSNGSFNAAQFGLNGDKAVAGDFDADGRSDTAVWRPSTGVWYAFLSGGSGYLIAGFGLPGDIPAPADYDGDRRTDISVFRPSTGIWYRINSGSNSFSAMQFGLPGDIAVPGSYIQ